jgi:aminoglycoside/choline kinase family phosphotransferase
MARNLVPRPRPRPAASGDEAALVVLDHQDLRLGPPGYDLASLLNDSLFPPAELEEGWLARVLPPGEAPRLAYHRAAAQRTLKAVGTFAAFARRGSDRHLPLIPPTLERALYHLGRLPEGRKLAPELERRWRQAASAASPGDGETTGDLLDSIQAP